jgi:RNA polymerase sigma-70 factor (ECF subfamily)
MDQETATRVVNELFDSLGAFLVRYALRRTGSHEVANDLVQEAFLALYRDLRTGKQIQDPKLWTIGAVRNQIRKHARTIRRRHEDLTDPDSLDLYPARPFPFATDDERPPVALSVLTPREEEVVLLRLQSLKYREIGAQLGIGAKSVCTLLTRAIRKLRSVSDPLRERSSGSRREDEVPNALQ